MIVRCDYFRSDPTASRSSRRASICMISATCARTQSMMWSALYSPHHNRTILVFRSTISIQILLRSAASSDERISTSVDKTRGSWASIKKALIALSAVCGVASCNPRTNPLIFSTASMSSSISMMNHGYFTHFSTFVNLV